MTPKYSIAIITYNQAKLFGRAIDSVLCQKEHVYEIIVSDDCSTDETWTVIQKYQKRYPELIRPFRNTKNLGIFGNLESTWSKVSGDVIFYLSGDDAFCNGLFEKANELIYENGIDFKGDMFTLYFDWKYIDPSGNERSFTNSLIRKHNPVSLRIRRLIHNRTTGISKKVLEQFIPIRKDIGICADDLIDIQTMQFSKINLYSPFVGSVYYGDIGIASTTSYIEKTNSVSLVSVELLKSLKGLSKSDINWLQYRKYKSLYIMKPDIFTFYHYLKYLIKIIEFKYGKDFVYKEIKFFIKTNIRVLKHKSLK